MDLPTWATALIAALLGAGGGGGIVVAIISNRPNLLKARTEAEAATVEQWRQLHQDAREELARLKSEAEKVTSSYYGLLGLFVQFRNDVRTGVSDVIVAMDRKDFEKAQQHAETLGRMVAGVRLPTENP